MAELTLKDESVLEIGKSVSQSFEGLAKTGKSLLVMPSGQPLEVKADEVEVLDKEPQKGAAQVIFENIRDGINRLVEVFTSSFAFQKQEAAEEDLQQRVSEAQATEDLKEEDTTDRSFFTQEFKDKISELTAGLKERTMAIFGGLGGMLKKGGLLALLLVFALNMNKFSGQVGETLKPILEGFKKAFKSLSEDVFPIIENIISFVGSAFSSFSNLLQGLFQGDGSKFMEGLQGVLLDLPLRIVSIIGDGFFSLVDAVLKMFGVESETIQNIKLAFRTLPEAVKKAINDSITFITETIPQYFEDLKNQAIQNAKDNIESIKQMFKNAFNFITEDIPNYFGNLVDDVINSIKETVKSIKDAIMEPIRAVKEKVSGMFSSVKSFFGGNSEEKIVKANAKDMSLEEAKALQRKVFDDIHEKRSSGEYTGAEKARMQMYNNLVIDKDPTRGEDHKALNSMNPMLYADYDYRGEEQRNLLDLAAGQALDDRTALRSAANMMSPENLKTGSQLNKESAELTSTPPTTSNMQVNNGGTTNNTTANNTYTNILEDTATSDRNLRHYLST